MGYLVIQGVPVMTTAEVGARLHCGRAKVFGLRASGAINSVRVGNHTYSSVESVEQYLINEAQRIRAGLKGTGA